MLFLLSMALSNCRLAIESLLSRPYLSSMLSKKLSLLFALSAIVFKFMDSLHRSFILLFDLRWISFKGIYLLGSSSVFDNNNSFYPSFYFFYVISFLIILFYSFFEAASFARYYGDVSDSVKSRLEESKESTEMLRCTFPDCFLPG